MRKMPARCRGRSPLWPCAGGSCRVPQLEFAWLAGRCLFVAEAFSDRCYQGDGSLVPRSSPDAFVDDPVRRGPSGSGALFEPSPRVACAHYAFTAHNPQARAFVPRAAHGLASGRASAQPVCMNCPHACAFSDRQLKLPRYALSKFLIQDGFARSRSWAAHVAGRRRSERRAAASACRSAGRRFPSFILGNASVGNRRSPLLWT